MLLFAGRPAAASTIRCIVPARRTRRLGWSEERDAARAHRFAAGRYVNCVTMCRRIVTGARRPRAAAAARESRRGPVGTGVRRRCPP
ncbi:hypothetical protein KDX16_13445, partial [Burkholderia vietnamiensis]|uniref:hypothetical protein n=1 Tax=Burkholderia vietnamiensis TaxID=60552 RepID=UPI001BA42995